MLDRRYERQFGRVRLIEQLLGSGPVREIVTSRDDVVRFLRGLRADPWARQWGISTSSIAGVIGKDQNNLRGALFGRHKRLHIDAYVQAVAEAMAALDSGELCITRAGSARGGVFRWIEKPAKAPPRQPPVLVVGDWKYWSRCVKCGCRRYVRLSGGHAACSVCLPDPRVIGDRIADRHLPVPDAAQIH